jgi:hypothetical protein
MMRMMRMMRMTTGMEEIPHRNHSQSIVKVIKASS